MRPHKERQVEQLPPVSLFKPVGGPICNAAEIVISVDEMEAIRLADLEGFDQGKAAGQMGVSRPTFHRMLAKAHGKLAEFLWQGTVLRIEGGNYRMRPYAMELRKFVCDACGHEWEVSLGQGGRCCEVSCPRCQMHPVNRSR